MVIFSILYFTAPPVPQSCPGSPAKLPAASCHWGWGGSQWSRMSLSPRFQCQGGGQVGLGVLLPVDALLGTREEQRDREQERGAEPRRLVGRRSWNHLERLFAGRARTKGDGRRDAMTTFGGFPGNQGRHGNCITPVGISDFRWKACSPL